MVCLSDCYELSKVEGLNRVPIVHFRHCHKLQNLGKGLGENQEVILEN
jgi:hypothetical protein